MENSKRVLLLGLYVLFGMTIEGFILWLFPFTGLGGLICWPTAIICSFGFGFEQLIKMDHGRMAAQKAKAEKKQASCRTHHAPLLLELLLLWCHLCFCFSKGYGRSYPSVNRNAPITSHPWKPPVLIYSVSHRKTL